MEILITVALGFTATIFVLWPLIKGDMGFEASPVFSPNRGWTDLLLQKEAAIGTLKELEFDYVSGKLSHDDYSRLSAGYENSMIRLLKELDEYDSRDPLSQALEEEILAVRKKEKSNDRFCVQCGSPVTAGFNYCPDCGGRVNHGEVGGDR